MTLPHKGLTLLNRARAPLNRTWEKTRKKIAPPAPQDAFAPNDDDVIEKPDLQQLLAACLGLSPHNMALRNALPALAAYKPLIPSAAGTPSAEKILQLQSPALTLTVTPSAVTTTKEDLTAADAATIALLCSLNPAMQKEPVQLHGNARECYLLYCAVTARGLTIENPESFAALTEAEKEDLAQEWAAHAAPAQAPVPTEESKTAEPTPEKAETDEKPEQTQPALPDSVQQILARAQTQLPEKVRTLLDGAAIDEKSYRAAREFVIAYGKAPLSRLRKDFTLSTQQAQTLLEALHQEGITAKTTHTKTERKTRTSHHVVLKPGQPLPPPSSPAP